MGDDSNALAFSPTMAGKQLPLMPFQDEDSLMMDDGSILSFDESMSEFYDDSKPENHQQRQHQQQEAESNAAEDTSFSAFFSNGEDDMTLSSSDSLMHADMDAMEPTALGPRTGMEVVQKNSGGGLILPLFASATAKVRCDMINLGLDVGEVRSILLSSTDPERKQECHDNNLYRPSPAATPSCQQGTENHVARTSRVASMHPLPSCNSPQLQEQQQQDSIGFLNSFLPEPATSSSSSEMNTSPDYSRSQNHLPVSTFATTPTTSASAPCDKKPPPAHKKTRPNASHKISNRNSKKSSSSNTSNNNNVNHDIVWETLYSEMKDYKQKFGTCAVPMGCKIYPQLAMWIKRQRYQYKQMRTGKRSSMTSERQQKLDAIGFVWQAQQDQWLERYRQLQEFKAKHGHCLLKTRYPENPALGSWVKCQRTQYRKFLLDDPSSNMTSERVDLLNELGFVWNPPRSGGGIVTPAGTDDSVES